jgi:2,4-didehydro-3-deoxy-L-rhamnonate hydrolase
VRLARFGAVGSEHPGVIDRDGSTLIDLSDVVHDYDAAFFASGGPERLGALLADARRLPRRPLDGVRLGPPIAKPEKIVCIGLNYADHVAEANFPMPAEPLVFLKAPNSMVGPTDQIRIPRAATRVDWEVELAVVIGRRARYLADEAAANDVIAGYTVANDLSERGFQLDRGGEWAKGKSCETFNPLGPWLVTPDEAGDVGRLDMWLDVNGVRRQTSNTANMIWPVAYLVWYLSQFMVLEPGDVVNTGTPGGVGNLQHPPVYLSEGQVVTLGITGLGAQRTVCVGADA